MPKGVQKEAQIFACSHTVNLAIGRQLAASVHHCTRTRVLMILVMVMLPAVLPFRRHGESPYDAAARLCKSRSVRPVSRNRLWSSRPLHPA